MAARKLLPKLKKFLDALGDRYQRVLQIIDEALNSNDFAEKKWAVDLVLKRSGPPEDSSQTTKPSQKSAPTSSPNLQELSNEALLQEIRKSLQNPHSSEPE